jgi:Tol biopolymer transport system component
MDTGSGVAWSPGGDLLASAGRYEVRITDTTSGESRIVSPAAGPDDYLGFTSWLPNGNELVICSGQSSDPRQTLLSPGTYIIDLTGGPTRQIADTCVAQFTADGESFVYTDGEALYIAPTDGSEPPRFLIEGYQPQRFSPDGDLLTLAHDPCETGDDDVYSVEVATGAVTQLTNSPEVSKESAGWSANGELAYSAVLSPESYSLVLLAPNLESRTLLTSAQHIHGPTWSPDGRYLSFVVGFGHGACGY